MKLKQYIGRHRTNLVTYGVVILGFVIMQMLSASHMLSSSVEGFLVPICAYVVLAVSLNLVVGISGELSLGHAGFMGVGAFTGIIVAALLKTVIASKVLLLIVAIVCGGVMAGLFGVVIGLPVMRLRGDYLAIVTLAFGEILKNLINNMYVGSDANGVHFVIGTGKPLLAEGGSMVINGPMGATGVTKLATFPIGFALILVTLFVVLNLINSREGRAIKAVRDNRIAAESVGINVTAFRLKAFVVSAFLAGMAGALYGLNYSSLTASKFNFNTSINILVFVVLGGIGNIRGSVIAAALLTILPELLRSFNDYRMLVYAVVLIVVMLATNSERSKQWLAVIKSRLSREEKGEAER